MKINLAPLSELVLILFYVLVHYIFQVNYFSFDIFHAIFHAFNTVRHIFSDATDVSHDTILTCLVFIFAFRTIGLSHGSSFKRWQRVQPSDSRVLFKFRFGSEAFKSDGFWGVCQECCINCLSYIDAVDSEGQKRRYNQLN